LRGVAAKLEHPVNAVKLLKQQYPHIYVTALSVIHKDNLESVSSIIDFCYKIGCDKWTHDELYALGRGSQMSKIGLELEILKKQNAVVASLLHKDNVMVVVWLKRKSCFNGMIPEIRCVLKTVCYMIVCSMIQVLYIPIY